MKFLASSPRMGFAIPAMLLVLVSCQKYPAEVDNPQNNRFTAEFNGQLVNVASSQLGQSSGAFVSGNSLTIVADGDYNVPMGRVYIYISNYTGASTYPLGSGGSFAYYKPAAGDTCFVEAGKGLGSVTVEHLGVTSYASNCPDLVFGGTRPCTFTTVDLGIRFWFDAFSRNGQLMKVTNGSFFLHKTR